MSTAAHIVGLWTPGLGELLVVLLICLVLFGASRLPEIGRSLGRGIQEFKKATKEMDVGDDLNQSPPSDPESTSKLS